MLDFQAINERALPNLPAILPDLLPGGRIQGREYRCGDLSGGVGNSFGINMETGKWSDFATGDSGGDVIGLVAVVKGLSQAEAARILSEQIGITVETRPKNTQRRPEKNLKDILNQQQPRREKYHIRGSAVHRLHGTIGTRMVNQ